MLYMTVCHIYDIHMTSCVCYVFNHWLITSKISHYYDLAAGNSKDRVNTRCWLVTAVVVGVAAVVAVLLGDNPEISLRGVMQTVDVQLLPFH